MLRQQFNEQLKAAIKNKELVKTSTLRLILAALKDRDIAARSKGNDGEGIPDNEIMSMLQSMIKQREQSIELYEKGNRPELAEKERKEIDIISQFLPQQLNPTQLDHAIDQAIQKTGAHQLKDMGKVINHLKEAYVGQIDFAQASSIIKKKFS